MSPSATHQSSAAVEHVVAKVLHFEDRGVGPALDRVWHMRLDDLGDDDVVVALLDDAGDLALDRGQGGVEDRRAVRPLVDRLAAELAVWAGLKNVKASPLCSLPSMLSVKFLVFLTIE